MIWNQNRRIVITFAAIISLVSACDPVTKSPETAPVNDAGEGVAQIATGDTGSGSAVSAVAEPNRPVVAETLPYAEVSDQLIYGYFAFPADMVDPLPGIIVIHGRWGLDDVVREQAERVAAQGYVVLAIDLYRGRTAADITSARPLMVEVVENPEFANENIRQAYQFLINSGQAPKIGVLGWSFGGGWALNAALLFPDDLDAAVIYYGQVMDNHDRLGPLHVPILGLFGEKDRGVTVETVKQFDAAMEFLDKDYEIEIYPGVGHGFAEPGAPTYDADVAEKAWQRAIEFLGKYLLEDTV